MINRIEIHQVKLQIFQDSSFHDVRIVKAGSISGITLYQKTFPDKRIYKKYFESLTLKIYMIISSFQKINK